MRIGMGKFGATTANKKIDRAEKYFVDCSKELTWYSCKDCQYKTMADILSKCKICDENVRCIAHKGMLRDGRYDGCGKVIKFYKGKGNVDDSDKLEWGVCKDCIYKIKMVDSTQCKHCSATFRCIIHAP